MVIMVNIIIKLVSIQTVVFRVVTPVCPLGGSKHLKKHLDTVEVARSSKLFVTRMHSMSIRLKKKETKLHGLSSQVNYTDQATATCRRS
jgi:hypothetical protein